MSTTDREIRDWYAQQRLGDDAVRRILDAPRRRPWWGLAVLPVLAAAAVLLLWPTAERPRHMLVPAALEEPYTAAPARMLPEGLVTTTVPMRGQYLEFVRPGNWIDVLVHAEGLTETLFQSVVVYATDREQITLLTTVEDGERLQDANDRGILIASVRNDLDVEHDYELGGGSLMKLSGAEYPAKLRFRADRQRTAARTNVDRLSTFALDVDPASWSRVRSALIDGRRPPLREVRTEELVNAQHYEGPRPPTEAPFAASFELAPSPWTDGRDLLRIGLTARDLPADAREPLHLTLLVDTSGSMASEERLDLARRSLMALVRELGPADTVAAVAFADEPRVALQRTAAEQVRDIAGGLAGLQAGGSTDLEAGLRMAYGLAEAHLDAPGQHRVVLCTDGIANRGTVHAPALAQALRGWADQGITLTALGFGRGGYRDDLMETLADRSDGNYAYIDEEREAERVLSDQMLEHMLVVARDAKVQVEWAPETVLSWRLVGYADRQLTDREFASNAADAGEVGPGHRITALYELERSGAEGRLGTLRLRSEPPGAKGQAAFEQQFAIEPVARPTLNEATADMRIATAAAGLGLLLDGSRWADVDPEGLLALARGAMRPEYPRDAELVELIRLAPSVLQTRPRPPRVCSEMVIWQGGKQVTRWFDENGVSCDPERNGHR